MSVAALSPAALENEGAVLGSPAAAAPRLAQPADPALEAAIREVAHEAGLSVEAVRKRVGSYRALLASLGFVPDDAVIAPAFQLQWAPDRPSPAKPWTLRRTPYLGVHLDRLQMSARVEFRSAKELVAATLRVDRTTLRPTQLAFEIAAFGPRKGAEEDLFACEEVRVLANLDAVPAAQTKGSGAVYPPAAAWTPGAKGFQLGVSLRLRALGVRFIAETLVVFDYTALVSATADTAWSDVGARLLYVAANVQKTLDASEVPGLGPWLVALGGKPSVTIKAFFRVAATPAGWLRAAGLVVEAATGGGAVAARGAQLLAEAARAAVAEGPLLGSALVTNLIAVSGIAAPTLGLWALHDRLTTGRDASIRNAVIAGYAEQLEASVLGGVPEARVDLVRRGEFPWQATLDRLTACVQRGETCSASAGGDLPANALIAGDALAHEGRELGRFLVVAAIASLEPDPVRALDAWGPIAAAERARLAAARARGGHVTLRRVYLEALHRAAGGPREVGLPLRELERAWPGRS